MIRLKTASNPLKTLAIGVYNEGWEAFNKRLQLTDNPYNTDDELSIHGLWNVGYNDSRKEFQHSDVLL